MQFTTTAALLLSALAFPLPATSEVTEPFAVKVKTFDNITACRLDLPLTNDWLKDGTCHHLPNSRLDVNEIHDTCRSKLIVRTVEIGVSLIEVAVFIYENNDCSGWERQVYAGETCIDIKKFYSLKAFCH
ncbi:uncharacterized protein EI97DRAFT_429988 [Westerdykella ornata]|uniref:Uncharacterized protein n=1 Tax=Westerdykella ornata TaxID=318751 RepID=A0A6A6JUE9_WESOR|nr:uncharacterized protein EI97DRAFT_429988 [Westerdykella ornata]KAF2280241.1 hypothetical protein EI97DRAFT_429988 [Westerdykella ornata]